MSDTRTDLPVTGLQQIFDLGIVLVSFGTATTLIVHRQQTISVVQFMAIRTRISSVAIFVLALLTCHLALCVCGLYRSRRLSTVRAECYDVIRATSLFLICFAVISSIFSVQMMTWGFLSLFWIVSTVLLCVWRVLLRNTLASLRAHGRNLRYILVLGTNVRAVSFARRITTRPASGYRLLGFVDDEWPGQSDFAQSGFKRVCDCAGLAEFLRRNVVDEVAIYLPFRSFYRHAAEVAGLCEQHGISTRFNSDIFGRHASRWHSEELDGEHFIFTQPTVGQGWPRVIKRSLDIVGSAILLLLSGPLLVLVALAIKLSSPGPVFFMQERVGVNKRRFRMYKFRTMVPNAEKLMEQLEARNEVTGPVFKIKDDPRITPVGKLLRRSSIDELPQLLNVLKGEMSLVGPRPLPFRDYEGFSEDWQRRRFSVKPGITCLWQVSGRSGISFDQWMLLDMQYMDEWSLWLDIKILAKTVPAVLKGEGAA